MGDPEAIGRVGVITVATRGSAGCGEVQLKIRGGTESYLAWSDEPLSKGTTVLAIESRGARAVHVVEWSAPPELELSD